MATGPLAGVRVVEVAGIGPGPFCGMILADFGADVVRAERPGGGLTLVPWERDLLNRGKRSVAADLKSPEGVATVLALAGQADILFEGFRPGVAERLGIGPAACWERNPALVYGRMTGWGQDGPLAHTAGHDIAYIGPTGALNTIGEAGGAPQIPVNYVGDFGGGSLYLAVGMLAALHEARASGNGQVVDAAIVDGAAHLTTMLHGLLATGAWRDERGANLVDGGAPFYSVYQTSDGRYMAVGALEPQFYREFVTILGIDLDDIAQDNREQWPELRRRIAAAFGQRTQQAWASAFDGTDACVAPVLSLAEAPHHPHLRARDTFIELDGVAQPAPAPRFSRTPGSVARPPCTPGEHTEQVLADWGVSVARSAR